MFARNPHHRLTHALHTTQMLALTSPNCCTRLSVFDAKVHESSTQLVLSTQRFLLAWFNLLLPFWSDLLTASVAAWQVLDTRIKWGIAVVAAVTCVSKSLALLKQASSSHETTVASLGQPASLINGCPCLQVTILVHASKGLENKRSQVLSSLSTHSRWAHAYCVLGCSLN